MISPMMIDMFFDDQIHHYRVSVVIPVFNESSLIQEVIESIPIWVKKIIAVDDASIDSSADVINQINDSRLNLIRHKKNYGVGAAIVTGYRKALEYNSDFIVVIGGDAQMDPSEMASLLKPLISDKADYVKGNRFWNRTTQAQMPIIRRVGNVVLSYLTLWALQCDHFFDSQCGYTAIRSHLLNRIQLDTLYHGYGFPNDILYQITKIGGRIHDVPVKAIYASEKSGIRVLRDVPKIIIRILFLGLNRRWYILMDLLKIRRTTIIS